MIRSLLIIAGLLLTSAIGYSQPGFQAPIVQNNYETVTTNAGLTRFLQQTAQEKDFMHYSLIGESNNGKPIPMVTIARAPREGKLDVLFFGQQHGNEPAGKEGLLLFIDRLAQEGHDELLQHIRLHIIPQVNPDGGDAHKRKTADGTDPNRDHLMMSTPEVYALHQVFDRIKPELSVDFHEYYPYSDTWKEFGYVKDFDIQVGTLTNPNVKQELVRFSKTKALPYIQQRLETEGYSFFEYTLGTYAEGERLRYSTADINDGRQSIGMTNTLSFIVEGKRGPEKTDNLKKRTISQYYTALAFAEIAARHKESIAHMVHQAKARTRKYRPNQQTAIRIEHVSNGDTLQYPLKSLKTGKQKVFEVAKYHPVVEARLKVSVPKGYLIPKSDDKLVQFLNRSLWTYRTYSAGPSDRVIGYQIQQIETSVDEGLENYDPILKRQPRELKHPENYYFVPTSQVRKHKIVIALEPHSMYGIVNEETFDYLMAAETVFKVLRVE